MSMFGAIVAAISVTVLLLMFSERPLLVFLLALPVAVIATPILLVIRIMQERRARQNDESPPPGR